MTAPRTATAGVVQRFSGPASTDAMVEMPAGEYGPWNPGIRSQLPREFLPLATIFRPENVVTGVEEAHEHAAFTGLDAEEHVVFRPERLLMHEVLIRVTADLSVPDGPNYEDLGINFRRMVGTILGEHLQPHVADIVRAYDDLRTDVAARIESELRASLFAPARRTSPEADRSGFLWFFGLGGSARTRSAPAEPVEVRERRVLERWRERAEAADDALDATIHRVLLRLGEAIAVRHGRLCGEPALLTTLAAGMVLNEHGSRLVGRMIAPRFRRAAEQEGYRLLPAQARPVVMNVKGASASGKSTMRPRQRKLAERLGVPWSDFALISPDIWRKYLLDYESLGPAEKYAGTLTGLELQIIDQKLDRYMAEKAEQGRMSHLLIDRFRFDSFAEEPDGEEGSRLLTRFGHVVYMFFMITPPEATVERAWTRGRQFGRYKAVDDLLAHNIEAYTGMPRLFFTWAGKHDKSVHYEFLDNSVAEGERPRTVAFGWNAEMNVLDIKGLLDVERYRKIDIDATDPASVYPDAGAMAPEANTGFLEACAGRIAAINFVERESGRVYARMEAGRLTFADPSGLARALADPDTRAGFAALAPEALQRGFAIAGDPPRLDPEAVHTLGQWGAAGDGAGRSQPKGPAAAQSGLGVGG